jgi:hypothetical protein
MFKLVFIEGTIQRIREGLQADNLHQPISSSKRF